MTFDKSFANEQLLTGENLELRTENEKLRTHLKAMSARVDCDWDNTQKDYHSLTCRKCKILENADEKI